MLEEKLNTALIQESNIYTDIRHETYDTASCITFICINCMSHAKWDTTNLNITFTCRCGTASFWNSRTRHGRPLVGRAFLPRTGRHRDNPCTVSSSMDNVLHWPVFRVPEGKRGTSTVHTTNITYCSAGGQLIFTWWRFLMVAVHRWGAQQIIR